MSRVLILMLRGALHQGDRPITVSDIKYYPNFGSKFNEMYNRLTFGQLSVTFGSSYLIICWINIELRFPNCTKSNL